VLSVAQGLDISLSSLSLAGRGRYRYGRRLSSCIFMQNHNHMHLHNTPKMEILIRHKNTCGGTTGIGIGTERLTTTTSLRMNMEKDSISPDRYPYSDDDAIWTLAEDQEILSRVQSFTIGTGLNAATLWSPLVHDSILLSFRRTPEECERRMEWLGTTNATATAATIPPYGKSPPILDRWERMFVEDGVRGRRTAMVGRIDGGQTVWFDVEYEGRLSVDTNDVHRSEDLVSPLEWNDDDRLAPSFVVARGGRVYQLGHARLSPTQTVDRLPRPLTRIIDVDWKDIVATAAWKSLQQFGGVVLLAQLVLFGLTINDPPSYFPTSALHPVTITIPEPFTNKLTPSTTTSTTPAPATARKVSLTLNERIARQRLRVDAVSLALQRWEAQNVDAAVRTTRAPIAERLRVEEKQLNDLLGMQERLQQNGGRKGEELYREM